MTAMVVDPTTWAGYITHRMTGTPRKLVVLVEAEPQGIAVEDGGRYALICDAHGSIIQDTNKRRLLGWIHSSFEWCEGCRAAFDAEDEESREITEVERTARESLGWLANEDLNRRAAAAVTHEWTWDPIVDGVIGLVRVGTNRADIVVYVEKNDFEVSGEWEVGE